MLGWSVQLKIVSALQIPFCELLSSSKSRSQNVSLMCLPSLFNCKQHRNLWNIHATPSRHFPANMFRCSPCNQTFSGIVYRMLSFYFVWTLKYEKWATLNYALLSMLPWICWYDQELVIIQCRLIFNSESFSFCQMDRQPKPVNTGHIRSS